VNLLSVLYLTKHKAFDVHISGDHMDFIRNGTTLFTASINECNVGYLNGSTIERHTRRTASEHISL